MKSPLSVLLKIITYDFIIAQPPCNVKFFSNENKNVKKTIENNSFRIFGSIINVGVTLNIYYRT